MFSLPDFKEKQLLIINTDKKEILDSLKFRNDNIVYKKNGKVVNQASCHKVFCVFLVGDASITTRLIKQLVEHGVSLFFLKHNLSFYSSINAQTEGNYLLREKQYNLSKKKELSIAKRIIYQKILNQGYLLKSQKRIGNWMDYKKEIKSRVESVSNTKSLLGVEGNYSKDFFKEYFKTIGWYRRWPRVKADEINLLMDIGYTMLFNFVDAILRVFGFDTYKGVYHQKFWQRQSLSCDVTEVFRCIIDREILKIYNLEIFDKKDFKFYKGRYSLPYKNSAKYTVVFLKALMANKVEIFSYCQSFYRYFMDSKKNEFPKLDKERCF